MKRFVTVMMGLVLLGMVLPAGADIVTDSLELHLNANHPGSWYGGPSYDGSGGMDSSLPQSDTWFNLVGAGAAYGHNLGDIDDGGSVLLPESQPGAVLGDNSVDDPSGTAWLGAGGVGTGADRANRNPAFTAGGGGSPSYFSGTGGGTGGATAAGAEITITRSEAVTSDFSWELWFRPATSNAAIEGETPCLMGNQHYSNGTGFQIFEMLSGGQRQVIFRAMEGSRDPSQVSAVLNIADTSDPQEWFHLVATFSSAGEQNLYIDGQLADSATGVGIGGATTSAIGLLWPGPDRSGHKDHSDADIAIARIYHKVLSLSEVQQNFATGADYIPEPATIGLLAMGGLALLRRRKA